ncbi:MAG: glutamate 5-kinase [Colwellia sp.]|nr:glutamate 5-kinase [Colwellia sp.]
MSSLDQPKTETPPRNKTRIVIKVGSSLVANVKNLTPSFAFMHGLLNDISTLRDQGYEVVLTSSGSVALGLNSVGCTIENASIQDKQAAAACGQPILMHAYRQIALEYGFDIAQVLVTLDDLENRRRFLNVKNTVHRLIKQGVMPIVNENDTVTTEEIRVGDNDRLGAKIAQMIGAEYLFILTCIDGVYDRDPSEEGAVFVESIEDVSSYMEAASGTSSLGTGGMLTKLQAANMAQNAGCTTFISKGTMEYPVTAILSGERKHTKCIAHSSPSSAWNIWLTDRLQMAGSLVIKQDIADSLFGGDEGFSCHDVVSIHGSFERADVLHVYDEKGEEIARGLCNFSSDETTIISSRPDETVKNILGYTASHRLINSENLVVLAEHHLPWDEPVTDD